MSKGKDSIAKIIGVTLGVCMVCSILVSATAIGLRSRIEANKAFDRKKNILIAAGLVESKERPSVDQVDKLYADNIDGEVLDLQSETIVPDLTPQDIDWRKMVKDPDTSVQLSQEIDIARIKKQSEMMPIYLLRDNAGKIERVILPIYGKGLWSTMYGFISLESDLQTVGQITFYEHGETPGLGGEIASAKWQGYWPGKKVYAMQPAELGADENPTPVIHVIKGSPAKDDPESAYKIDGISGATLTCNGVTDLMEFWLGDNGYGPYLKKLAEEEKQEAQK